MSIAFLFPGQGVAIADVALEWRRHSPRVEGWLRVAADLLGTPLETVFARGGRLLQGADVLEPIQTALMIGIQEELVERGVRAEIVAGHSLGELAACAAAGYLDPADAIGLGIVRGRLMHREALKHPGGMVAIHTTDRAVAEAAVSSAAPHGMVAVAAHNAPDQWLIAGEWSALRVVAERFGAMPLPVAGAWHSPAMAGAVAEYFTAAAAIARPSAQIPFVSNRTGRIVSDPADIPTLLAEMLTHPVLWVDAVTTLLESGVSDAIIIAPSRVLGAMTRRTLGSRARMRSVDLPADLSALAAELAA